MKYVGKIKSNFKMNL